MRCFRLQWMARDEGLGSPQTAYKVPKAELEIVALAGKATKYGHRHLFAWFFSQEQWSYFHFSQMMGNGGWKCASLLAVLKYPYRLLHEFWECFLNSFLFTTVY